MTFLKIEANHPPSFLAWGLQIFILEPADNILLIGNIPARDIVLGNGKASCLHIF